jgi:hypothetical protein
MMLWCHDLFRKSQRAMEAQQVFANFRLWVGLVTYCAVNLLCWFAAWGSYRAAIYAGIVWGIALPAVAVVALLILKLRSPKEIFTWSAFAAAAVSLVVAGWVNVALLQAIVGAV